MFQAFFLAIGQLFDGRVAWVFLKSLFLTLLLLAAVAAGMWFGMHRLMDGIAPWLGQWFDPNMAADLSAIVLILLLHLILFRVVAIAVMGIFADEVVEAVESKHYPEAHAAVRNVPLRESVPMGIGAGVRALLLNLLFSPLYLIALPLAPFVFFLVNAWLLGRDFGDMVAIRHMPARELPRWRSRTRFRRLTLGAIGTALLLIPVVAFLAPVIGAAMAAHLFHQKMRR